MRQEQFRPQRLNRAIQYIMAASFSLLYSQTLFAAQTLQALDDQGMAETTGEGIAFVLDNFKMRFNGVDDGVGTGYTYLIPVGPLSDVIAAHNLATANANGTAVEKRRAAYNIQIGKGDVYLYGTAISGNDNNANTQFSDSTVNIGTPDNPWLIQAKTNISPNFSGVDKELSALQFEAPLLTNLNAENFNLKVGMWADAFVRDPSKPDKDSAQFHLNGATRPLSPTNSSPVDRENRLRLQAVMNGVGINGTNISLFQTLDGANTATGLGPNYSYYNNTLGLAATLRINSGNASAVRGASYTETITSDNTVNNTGAVSGWVNLHGGWTTNISTLQSNTGAAVVGGATSCNNGGSVTTELVGSAGCRYMVQTRYRDDSKTRTTSKSFTWGTATGLNNRVLRFSTREASDSPNKDNVLYSPALVSTGATMPKFADSEGLYLYNPNVNLVLGSKWQPLILGVADDGKNFSIELTRIPNEPKVYKQIYTAYSGATGGLSPTEIATYKGGTCSVYWCGDATRNATHSSITIGSTNTYATDSLGTGYQTAYTGSDAIGVAFGDLMTMNGQTLNNTASTTGTTVRSYQAQWVEREVDSSVTWLYRQGCNGRFLGICTGTDERENTGTILQWKYGTSLTSGKGNITSFNGASYGGGSGSGSDRYRYPTVSGTTYGDSGNTSTVGRCPVGNDCEYYGTIANRGWTFANLNSTYGLGTSPWQAVANGKVDSWLASQGSAARTYNFLDGSNAITNQSTAPQPKVYQPYGAVNLGSAVIDGLLIQHMKITTKGL